LLQLCLSTTDHLGSPIMSGMERRMPKPLTTRLVDTWTIQAVAASRVGGRKRLLTSVKMEAAKTLLAGGTPPKDVARSFGVSVPTLYRWLPAGERG